MVQTGDLPIAIGQRSLDAGDFLFQAGYTAQSRAQIIQFMFQAAERAGYLCSGESDRMVFLEELT